MYLPHIYGCVTVSDSLNGCWRPICLVFETAALCDALVKSAVYKSSDLLTYLRQKFLIRFMKTSQVALVVAGGPDIRTPLASYAPKHRCRHVSVIYESASLRRGSNCIPQLKQAN